MSGEDGSADEQFFEPFYSRDSLGRGSGLGLFICRQLAQANDGTLSYRSAENGEPHAFVLGFTQHSAEASSRPRHNTMDTRIND